MHNYPCKGRGMQRPGEAGLNAQWTLGIKVCQSTSGEAGVTQARGPGLNPTGQRALTSDVCSCSSLSLVRGGTKWGLCLRFQGWKAGGYKQGSLGQGELCLELSMVKS